jgi:amino-acid N-acetyltransferase
MFMKFGQRSLREEKKNEDMLRQATIQDAILIYTLLQTENSKVVFRSLDDILDNIKNFIVYQTSDDTISGCIAFENYSSKIAEIRSLVVAPFFRKQGVGTALVKQALKKAKRGQEVFVVTSAREFFNNIGFGQQLNEKYILFKQK